MGHMLHGLRVGCCIVAAILTAASAVFAAEPVRPVPLIFDTDMGNDIDDALALGVIHALESRGECRLLAVTVSKDDQFGAPYVNLVNTFYGRPDIPVGAVHGGKTPEDGNYTRAVCEARDGAKPRYPRTLARAKDAPEAVGLLREVLAGQPDRSVVIVVVGFSTNIARLLDSKPDRYSPLAGMDLVAKKCRLLSSMAGFFDERKDRREYNVATDIPAAQRVFSDWPTPIVFSGGEVGPAIEYPAVSIEHDFNYVAHHPLPEAYRVYLKMPYDRPTWDLTSVLYAVRPDRGYFALSAPGKVTVDEKGNTTHTLSPDGTRRYLKVDPNQVIRVREALVQLSSQPPSRLPTETNQR